MEPRATVDPGSGKHSGCNPIRVNRIFPGDPEEPDEIPGADEGTESHLHWRFLEIRPFL